VLLKHVYFISFNLTDFHIFSLLKKKEENYKQTYNKLENFLRSSLERFMRAVQFASCARTSPLEAFQLQMLFV